ncbi:hypothetical protein [Roseibium polysiphoniae]|uniref:Membrane-associated oxidoreductase n=1 Tax=Roseibium polysiphoniae TaxID=2571221 RepID=A0ABR9C4V7_9HYPH|nr:hypothetical protein [Roseibium polysiphoniae]MBD8874810.1 hypothetical protein [Roseibium polysiphoniae]
MPIRTFADIEALPKDEKLTEAEQQLLDNCKDGVPTVLGDGERPSGPSPEQTIRADLLRYLILGGCEECEVHEWGVNLTGAWISGRLDLSFATAKGATGLLNCRFEQKIAALQARFEALNLNGSAMPGVNAQGIRVTGAMLLRRLNSTGELSLSGAEIGGQLSFMDAKMDGGDGTALNAQGVRVTGGVFMRALKSKGEVRLSGAQIGGQLDCEDAELDGAGEYALNAQGVRLTGNAKLERLKSKGEVSLAGAQIGGQLECESAELDGGSGMALNVQGIRAAESVFLRGLKSKGVVSFSGAEVSGQLEFHDAELDGGVGDALNGQRLVVTSGLYWRHVKSVRGVVDLNSAHLGDLVDDAASWDKVADVALVGLTYDNLAGPLDLEMRKAWLKKGAKFDGSFYPQPYQQLARFFRETGHRREAREILIEKEVQQRRAARKRWSDERHFRSELRRFILNASEDTARKLATSAAKTPELSVTWLELSKQRFGKTEATKSRDPMVAEFLQQDFRNQLRWDNAKAVMRLFLNRGGDRIYRYVSGYGYKPGRSLLAMALLIAVMTVLAQVSWNMGDLAPNSDVIQISKGWQELAKTERRPSEAWIELYGQDYETFEPFFYAADVVIPIIDIGQTEAWTPSTERSWWGWSMFGVQKIFVILGWVVTAIAAASVTGMIRRDD